MKGRVMEILQDIYWAKIIELDGTTAKGRVFLSLLRGSKTAVDLHHPEVGGLAYSQRCTDLRRLGIPVESYRIDDKPYHRYSIIDAEWLQEFRLRRAEHRASHKRKEK